MVYRIFFVMYLAMFTLALVVAVAMGVHYHIPINWRFVWGSGLVMGALWVLTLRPWNWRKR